MPSPLQVLRGLDAEGAHVARSGCTEFAAIDAFSSVEIGRYSNMSESTLYAAHLVTQLPEGGHLSRVVTSVFTVNRCASCWHAFSDECVALPSSDPAGCSMENVYARAGGVLA